MNEKDRRIAERIWPQHFQPFARLWDDDKYAIQRTHAIRWLGDRYLCFKPVNRVQR